MLTMNKAVLDRVCQHPFTPLNQAALAVDRHSGAVGIADRDDREWFMRALAGTN